MENNIKFNILTLNDNGSGMEYFNKEDFLKEVSMMIDDFITNEGTQFTILVNADKSCFYQGD